MKLHPIVSPISEFEHGEKGDALYGKLYRTQLILLTIFVLGA